MTNEEKELIKAAKRNLKLMRACKEILEDINKINSSIDKISNWYNENKDYIKQKSQEIIEEDKDFINKIINKNKK